MLKKNVFNEIKQHYKNIYTKKGILLKIIAFVICALIVLLPAFLIREQVLSNGFKNFSIIDNFIDGQVEFNRGISFSGLDNQPELALALQLIISIIVLVIFLSNHWYFLDIGFGLIFFGGLGNIIDREIVDVFNGEQYVNTVVDYLKFSGIQYGAIFNFQDVMITVGWIALIIIIGVKVSVYYYKLKKVGKKIENEKATNNL